MLQHNIRKCHCDVAEFESIHFNWYGDAGFIYFAAVEEYKLYILLSVFSLLLFFSFKLIIKKKIFLVYRRQNNSYIINKWLQAFKGLD